MSMTSAKVRELVEGIAEKIEEGVRGDLLCLDYLTVEQVDQIEEILFLHLVAHPIALTQVSNPDQLLLFSNYGGSD